MIKEHTTNRQIINFNRAKYDMEVAEDLFNSALTVDEVDRAIYLLNAAEIQLNLEIRHVKSQSNTDKDVSKDISKDLYVCNTKGCDFKVNTISLADILPFLGGNVWYQRVKGRAVMHTTCPKCRTQDSFRGRRNDQKGTDSNSI